MDNYLNLDRRESGCLQIAIKSQIRAIDDIIKSSTNLFEIREWSNEQEVLKSILEKINKL